MFLDLIKSFCFRQLGCIFKALFMNESTLILRYKQKLFMAGTFVLICGVSVIIFFLSIAPIGFPGVSRPYSWLDVYHDKTRQYNCIYWWRFETLSGYKSSAILLIYIACTKANSYSNFVTRPPSLWRSFVVLCINKVWGVTPCGAVKSALRLPPSFWHCLSLAILFICLNLFHPTREALGR